MKLIHFVLNSSKYLLECVIGKHLVQKAAVKAQEFITGNWWTFSKQVLLENKISQEII